MLVKFALELDAIDGNVRADDLNILMKTWGNFGILVHPTPKDGAKIKNVSENLEQIDAKKCWTTMWTTVVKGNPSLRLQPLNEVSFDWEKIQSADDLAQHSGKFEVALLEETRAEVLGIGVDKTKKFDEIEGVRFANHSLWPARFERDPFYIKEGSDRKDIWEKNFYRLAEFSQEIVIVDRYAVQEPGIQGVFWLLERLTEIAKSSKIQVNAGLKSQQGQDRGRYEIEDEFKRKFHDKRIITTEVRLFDDLNPMSKIAHDRHIRFDNYVIGIGRGPAAIFSSEKISAGTDVHTRILHRGEKEEKEKELEGNSARIVHEFILPEGA